ncbi:2Fe-2S iron-sulfur cluster-binding protein [Jeongeupia sp. USM3]|uniref:2Fe-2S iron-sulfur cluster-binding protein n=1 Tax=Jeongeupia sp. USM3 TaxID=1906741 RepID=UPI0011AB3CC8|nr:2Fe-2S iron-sulfur cluster-binding protein [Jeongeupia sp. USM3]
MTLVLIGTAVAVLFATLLWWQAQGWIATWQDWRRQRAGRSLSLRVLERETVGGCVRLRLGAVRGRLPRFSAGQHLLVHGDDGARCYSLARWQRWPAQYWIAIKPEGRASSSIAAMPVGARISASLPRGAFHCRPSRDEEVLLIAGGIGITPLMAMLDRLRAAPPRRVTLVHAARTRDALLWHDELAALAGSAGWFDYRPRLSAPDAGWQGEQGRLSPRDVQALVADPARCAAWLCAGDGMSGTAQVGLALAGVAAGRIHRESFGPAAGAAQGDVRIALADGRSVRGGEAATLLAALDPLQPYAAAQCRAGQCGGCRSTLQSGEVRWLMRPDCAVADGEVLACCCAAMTDVVLQPHFPR